MCCGQRQALARRGPNAVAVRIPSNGTPRAALHHRAFQPARPWQAARQGNLSPATGAGPGGRPLFSVHRPVPSAAPVIREPVRYAGGPAWASRAQQPPAPRRRRRIRQGAALSAGDVLAALANRLAQFSVRQFQSPLSAILTALLVRTVPERAYDQFRPPGPLRCSRTRRPVHG